MVELTKHKVFAIWHLKILSTPKLKNPSLGSGHSSMIVSGSSTTTHTIDDSLEKSWNSYTQATVYHRRRIQNRISKRKQCNEFARNQAQVFSVLLHRNHTGLLFLQKWSVAHLSLEVEDFYWRLYRHRHLHSQPWFPKLQTPRRKPMSTRNHTVCTCYLNTLV